MACHLFGITKTNGEFDCLCDAPRKKTWGEFPFFENVSVFIYVVDNTLYIWLKRTLIPILQD